MEQPTTNRKNRRRVADTIRAAPEPSAAESHPTSVRNLLAALQKAQGGEDSLTAETSERQRRSDDKLIPKSTTKGLGTSNINQQEFAEKRKQKIVAKSGVPNVKQEPVIESHRARGGSVGARIGQPKQNAPVLSENKRQRHNSSSVQTFTNNAFKNQTSIPETSKGHRGLRIPEDVLVTLEFRFIENLPEYEKVNPIRMWIHLEDAHWHYIDKYVELEKRPDCPHMGLKEFARNMFSHVKRYNYMLPKLNELLQEHRAYKSKVPTYGGILLDTTLNYVLLVQGYYASANTWAFPKGKINETEPHRKCAVREVLEETGYDVDDHATGDEHMIIKYLNNDAPTTLFIFPDVKKNFPFAPKSRNEIRRIEWFNVSELPSHRNDHVYKDGIELNPNHYYNVHPFIPEIRRWIKKEQARRAQIPPLQLAMPANVPPITARMNSFTNSEQQFTPLSLNALFGSMLPPNSSPSSLVQKSTQSKVAVDRHKNDQNALMKTIENAFAASTKSSRQNISQPLQTQMSVSSTMPFTMPSPAIIPPRLPFTENQQRSGPTRNPTDPQVMDSRNAIVHPVMPPAPSMTHALPPSSSHFRPVGNSPAVGSSIIEMLQAVPSSSRVKSAPIAHPIPIQAVPVQKNAYNPCLPNSSQQHNKGSRISLSETSAFTAIPSSRQPVTAPHDEIRTHQSTGGTPQTSSTVKSHITPQTNNLTPRLNAYDNSGTSAALDLEMELLRMMSPGYSTLSSTRGQNRDSVHSAATDIAAELEMSLGALHAWDTEIQLCEAWKSFKLDRDAIFHGLPGFSANLQAH